MAIINNILNKAKEKLRVPYLLFKRVDMRIKNREYVVFTNDFGGDYFLRRIAVRYTPDSGYVTNPPNKWVPQTDYTVYVDLSATISGDGGEFTPYTKSEWQNFVYGCGYLQTESLKIFIKGTATQYGTALRLTGGQARTYYIAWNPDVNGPWRISTDLKFILDVGIGTFVEGGILFVENALGVRQNYIENASNHLNFCNMYIVAANFENVGWANSGLYPEMGNRYNLYNVDEYIFSGTPLEDSCIFAPIISGGGCHALNVAIDFTVDNTGGTNTYTNCDLLWDASLITFPLFTGGKSDFLASYLYSGVNPAIISGSDPTFTYAVAGLFGEFRTGIGTGYYTITFIPDGGDILISLRKSSTKYRYFTGIYPELFATPCSQGCIAKAFPSAVDNDCFSFGYKDSFRGSQKTFNWLVESNSIMEIEILRKETYPIFVDIVLEGFFVYDEMSDNIKQEAKENENR